MDEMKVVLSGGSMVAYLALMMAVRMVASKVATMAALSDYL